MSIYGPVCVLLKLGCLRQSPVIPVGIELASGEEQMVRTRDPDMRRILPSTYSTLSPCDATSQQRLLLELRHPRACFAIPGSAWDVPSRMTRWGEKESNGRDDPQAKHTASKIPGGHASAFTLAFGRTPGRR